MPGIRLHAHDPALPARLPGGRRSYPMAATLVAVVAVLTSPLALDPALHALDRSWLLGALPVLLLWTGLWLAIGRPLAAAGVVVSMMALLYFANRLKLAHLGIPVLPTDLVAIGQVATDPQLFARYVEPDPVLLAVIVSSIVASMLEPRPLRLRPWLRALGFTGVAALFWALPLGAEPWRTLYSDQELEVGPWMPREATERMGLVPVLVHFAQTAWPFPERPDALALAEFERRFGAEVQRRRASTLPAVLPDLIVVQSESFFDAVILDGIDPARHLRHFHRLAAHGLHGDLVVPTLGGLTTRTEFEVLTGISLSTMPAVQYPYQALVSRPLRSLPWALKRIGYRTEAVHPYNPRFYGRHRAYPALGFDEFRSDAAFGLEQRHGYFVSDDALFRMIMRSLESDTGDRPPRLVYAVTMENHGPWDEGRGLPADELAAIPVPATLDPVAADELRAFLHHLDRSDRALATLADWVLAQQRPTWLLYFGDHLPGLPDVFRQAGFVDGRAAHEQTVPWLLIGNGTVQDTRSLRLRASELSRVLLDTAGINRDRFLLGSGLLAADRALDDNTRSWLRSNLERARYYASEALPETLVARVVDWGPRDSTLLAAGADPWVRFDRNIGAPVLILDRQPLTPGWTSGNTIVARIGDDQRSRLAQRGGTLSIAVADASARTIGRIAVAPPGARPTDRCEVDDWGPREFNRNDPLVLQPDGSLGVWIRTRCAPDQATILFDGLMMPTFVNDRVVTAAVAPALLADRQDAPIRLIDRARGIGTEVGTLAIVD